LTLARDEVPKVRAKGPGVFTVPKLREDLISVSLGHAAVHHRSIESLGCVSGTDGSDSDLKLLGFGCAL
jgi:hypothetical protein